MRRGGGVGVKGCSASLHNFLQGRTHTAMLDDTLRTARRDICHGSIISLNARMVQSAGHNTLPDLMTLPESHTPPDPIVMGVS